MISGERRGKLSQYSALGPRSKKEKHDRHEDNYRGDDLALIASRTLGNPTHRQSLHEPFFGVLRGISQTESPRESSRGKVRDKTRAAHPRSRTRRE